MIPFDIDLIYEHNIFIKINGKYDFYDKICYCNVVNGNSTIESFKFPILMRY